MTEIGDNAVCLGCGYSLRGLPEPVCPECGRAFDPADPRTYRDKAAMPKWRWLARPPRWWHLAVVTGITGLVLWEESGMGFLLLALFCASRTVIPLVILEYVVRLSATIIDRRRSAEDAVSQRRGEQWRWYVTPLCIAVLYSTQFYDWPFRLRFVLSRGAFERVEREYVTGMLGQSGPQRVGLFHVEQIREVEPGVVYFVAGPWIGKDVGFIHRLDGPATHWFSWKAMGSNWYFATWPYD